MQWDIDKWIYSWVPEAYSEFIGDLCGSVYLDQGFMEYMKEMFGADVIEKMPISRKLKMLSSWEDDVKLNFGNHIGGDLEVNVPGMPDNDVFDVVDGYHAMDTQVFLQPC